MKNGGKNKSVAFIILFSVLVLSKVPSSIPFGTEILKTSISR